jgi:sec-independent protein translocase protein TatB
MFNVGPEKLMVVLFVALIVLGPDKLPNAARQVGKFLAEFRRISSGFQTELRSAMDITAESDTGPHQDPVEVAHAAVSARDADDADDDADEAATDGDATAATDIEENATDEPAVATIAAPSAEERVEEPVAAPVTNSVEAPVEAEVEAPVEAQVEEQTEVHAEPLAEGIPLGVDGPSDHAVDPSDDRGPQLESASPAPGRPPG